MILELTVENIAIIDKSAISLGPGFTAITGETGAGKSLLIDAISLALGGRADSDLVRSGATKGSVSLLADVSALPDVLTKCAEVGVEIEDGQLAIHRDVSAEGRSTVRLNGRPVSVSVLRELGALLVDLHGQHDHQALLVQDRQIQFLDAWIGSEAADLLTDVADRFAAVEGMKRRLSALRTSHRDREQRVDMLQFQIQEIEGVSPMPGESEALQAQIERLRHVERLRSATSSALNLLSENEGCAIEALGAAVNEVSAAQEIDSHLGLALKPLAEALAALQEGSRELRHYADELDMDPQALEEAAGRLDSIKRLFRKYGETEEGVIAHLESAKEQLASLTDSTSNEEELEAQLKTETELLLAQATVLSGLRRGRATEFAKLVTAESRELAIENAEFSVLFEPKPVDPNGIDLVTFLFTANAGESARPLSKVASGGEISRVMLGIKVASAGRAGVPTLIFDEVDTGLSGRAAAVTANKLTALARHYQVVVISHLPQIAAKADTHFRIEKTAVGERTVTKVTPLDGDVRLEEIARMLAGEQIGESALANAREMVTGR